MSLLKLRAVRRIVDNTDRQSVSASLRRRRMEIFLRFVRDMDPPVRVLDVGGTERYWLSVGVPDVIRLVLLNVRLLRLPRPGWRS